MATERQKAAARRNLERARAAQAARRQGKKAPRRFDVEVSASSWRELFEGGKATKVA